MPGTTHSTALSSRHQRLHAHLGLDARVRTCAAVHAAAEDAHVDTRKHLVTQRAYQVAIAGYKLGRCTVRERHRAPGRAKALDVGGWQGFLPDARDDLL